jgi:hypothetical protein
MNICIAVKNGVSVGFIIALLQIWNGFRRVRKLAKSGY